MGVKIRDGFLIVPNSDPTRFQKYDKLPRESCLNAHEDILTHLEVVARQYYLEPKISLTLAEELDQMEPLRRLKFN